MRYKLLLTTLFSVLLILSYSSSARNEADVAVELAKELNKLQLFDYTEYLLTQEIAKNSPEKDFLKIQLALTYFEMNKVDKAEEIISAIQSSSKYYADSRRALGINAIKKGKNEIAVKAFGEYFQPYLKTPPETKSGKDDFREAVGYFSYAYEQLGKANEAAKVMGYLKILEKPKEGGSTSADEREISLLACQAKIDAVEKMISEGKTGYETTLNDCIKVMRDLSWIQDSIAAFGYIETGRALFYLGRIDDALKELNDPNIVNIFIALDESFKAENLLDSSPSAFAAFWRGKIYLAKGDKATANPDKIAAYSEAAKNFFVILKNYTEFPRFNDTVTAFMSVKDKLETLGKKLKIPPEIEKELKGKSEVAPEGEQYFNQEKYEQAIPYFIDAIHKARKSSNMSDVLAKLAFSYVKTDQQLEALTIAGYLSDYYPKAQNTPLALVQVGEYLWSKSKGECNNPLTGDALTIYEDYLRNCPTDQYAGPLAARVAKVYYDKASKLAEETNKLPQGPEKVQKMKETKEAFKVAISKYIRVVENYSNTDFGISSYYLLGWCYSNSQDFLKAAETFLAYCEKESQNEKKKDTPNISDSKLRVGENFYQYASFLEKEAKNLRDKAESQNKDKKTEADVQPASAPVPIAPSVSAIPTEAKDKRSKDMGKPEAVQSDAAGLKPQDNEKPLTAKQMSAKADELDKLAKKYFRESIKHLKELTGTWCAKGGILENEKSPKTLSALENAYALIGWAYDGVDEKENACNAFSEFLKKYKTSKQVPVCMFRLGTLYLEMNKSDIASQVLEKLSNEFPKEKEGKQALSSLGKSMFDIGNYEKSIDAYKKIFDQNIELPVSTLQWISKNLSDCGGTHSKEGALLSMKAGDALLKLIKSPVLEEWIGKEKAKEIADKPDSQKKILNILKEKIQFEYATAAFWAADFETTIKTVYELLKNKNTPYLFDARFLRASAYKALKKYSDALRDYGDNAMDSTTAKKYDIYLKSQCLIGDLYMEQNDFSRASGAFSILSLTDLDDKSNLSPEVAKEQKEWIEYAIYKSAFCFSKLGRKNEAYSLVEKYKKYFPKGKFLNEIDKLPAPEKANKL